MADRRFIFVFLLAAAAAPGHVLRGGVVVTRDGKTYAGIVHLEVPAEAVLVRPDAASAPVRIPLSNVRRADFSPLASGVVSGGTLRGGWLARDVGALTFTGCSDYADGAFTLHGCGGGGLGESGEAFHFLYQPLPEQGQIIARVASLSGPGTSMAGVLIHGRIPFDDRFAAMVVTADGTRFMSRAVDPNPVYTVEGGDVKTPCWLKLVKTPTAIIAWQSADGKTWDQVAALPWISPAPALIGLVALSRAEYVPAIAVFDQVHLIVHGLKGEYFADSKFDSLRLTRVDGQVDFNWETGSPAASVPDEEYAVRWTGQIEGRFSERTAFALEADSGARLWIDGKIILDTRAAHHRDGAANLIAGNRHDLRIDYVKTGGVGGCHLSWASASLAPEIVPNAQLYFVPEIPEAGPATKPNPLFVAPPVRATRGLMLRDGSVIPGDPVSGDAAELRLRRPSGQEIAVPLVEIERINFRPVTAEVLAKLPSRKLGVLTEGGDFIEGDYRGLAEGRLKLSSVLFGLSDVSCADIATVRVRAHENAIPTSNYIVRTTGGGVYAANAISDDNVKSCVIVEHAVLGFLAFPAAELAEIEAPSR